MLESPDAGQFHPCWRSAVTDGGARRGCINDDRSSMRVTVAWGKTFHGVLEAEASKTDDATRRSAQPPTAA